MKTFSNLQSERSELILMFYSKHTNKNERNTIRKRAEKKVWNHYAHFIHAGSNLVVFKLDTMSNNSDSFIIDLNGAG